MTTLCPFCGRRYHIAGLKRHWLKAHRRETKFLRDNCQRCYDLWHQNDDYRRVAGPSSLLAHWEDEEGGVHAHLLAVSFDPQEVLPF